MNTTVFNMPSLESESQPSQTSSMDSDDVAKSSLDAPEKINCSNDLFSDQSDRSENLSTPEHKTNDDPTEPIKGLFDIDGECDDKLSPDRDDTTVTINTHLEKNFNELHRIDANSSHTQEQTITADMSNDMNKLFCDKNVVANISSSTSQMADNNMSSDYINMHHNENSSLPADMMMSTSETNNNDNYDDKTNAVKDNPDMDANDFPVVEKQQHSHQSEAICSQAIHPDQEQMRHFNHDLYQQFNRQAQQQQQQHQQQQQQQQHQHQQHQDNDSQYQYKMYSSMYMASVNGFGRPFNSNNTNQNCNSNNMTNNNPQQPTNQEHMQSAPFKPYQLDSPATPSTKLSSISSAPGTPIASDMQRQPHQPIDDPYNFVDDELQSMSPHQTHLPGLGMSLHQMRSNVENHSTGSYRAMMTMQGDNDSVHGGKDSMLSTLHNVTNPSIVSDMMPKKRGRKKKNSTEDGMSTPFNLSNEPTNNKQIAAKERKKHDRFNGMTEEEVSKRTLPDHLADNLDIIIVGINPGLFAAYRGHHYAGPGNHFWKCLYLSGLTHEQMNAEEDFKLLDYGIGFTNMVQRATKGSADLTRKEIKEGSRLLYEKLRRYRPKIAVFNGKLIFEVFSGKKDFNFGRQPECIEGTNTYMWVMPSSSARCAQLPRAADKVPFYAALKKFRDYLNGVIPHIDESECVFVDPKSKATYDNETNKSDMNINRFTMNVKSMDMLDASMQHHSSHSGDVGSNIIGAGCEDMTGMTNPLQMGIPLKKKRGRPKKVRGEGEENLNISVPRRPQNQLQISDLACDGMPKKKRGRPKKSKDDFEKIKLTGDKMNIDRIINETAMNTGQESFPPTPSKCSDLDQDTSEKQQTQKPPIDLYSQMSNNSLNSNNAMLQCSMDDGFNRDMQQSMMQFSSNDHTNTHHSQHTPVSGSPSQLSHPDLSNDLAAATMAPERLGTAAGNDTTNSPLANSHGKYENSDCVHGNNWNDHNAFAVTQQHQQQSHHWLSNPKPVMATNASNSQFLPQQHISNQQQQQQHHPFQPQHMQHQHSDEISPYSMNKQGIADLTTKSLSGLESLVDQIPSLNDSHLPESLSSTAQMDSPRQTETRLNEIPSMVGESHQSLPFANSCLYSSNYLSNVSSIGSPALREEHRLLSNSSELRCSSNRSRNSDGNSVATPSTLLSHYPSSNYSSSSSSGILPSSVSGLHSPNSPHTQTQTPPMNLNNSLSNHPFSVNNLAGNPSNYSLTPPPSTPSASMPVNSLNSMNTYPSFMATAMQQQPLYINEFYEKSPIPDFFQKAARPATVAVDPHLAPFYHSGSLAAYSQHTGFASSGYGFPTNDFFEKASNLPHIQSQTQSPSIIHMPSPNYPYGYNEHHRRQNYMSSQWNFEWPVWGEMERGRGKWD